MGKCVVAGLGKPGIVKITSGGYRRIAIGFGASADKEPPTQMTFNNSGHHGFIWTLYNIGVKQRTYKKEELPSDYQGVYIKNEVVTITDQAVTLEFRTGTTYSGSSSAYEYVVMYDFIDVE